VEDAVTGATVVDIVGIHSFNIDHDGRPFSGVVQRRTVTSTVEWPRSDSRASATFLPLARRTSPI
jgi:hypothetical protein